MEQQSETLSESTLVQDVCRIPRTRFTTSRTVENRCSCTSDGGQLQIACFLVGADTSSGAIHATMVPDSKKMDMPYILATAAKWVRAFVYNGYERSSAIASG